VGKFEDERDRRVSEILVERDRRYMEVAEERDRRYTEVALEREKALQIKEKADLAALELAREIQTYKDEKANELREQISRERGHYASIGDLKALDDKIEVRTKPVLEYVQQQLGGGTKQQTIQRTQLAIAGLILTAIIIMLAILKG